jgi:hypothetical protein
MKKWGSYNCKLVDCEVFLAEEKKGFFSKLFADSTSMVFKLESELLKQPIEMSFKLKKDKFVRVGSASSDKVVYGYVDGEHQEKFIKYSTADSALFLGNTILGGGGIGKGWGEMKMKPGLFARTALRFDYGRFNEAVSGVEIGLTAEYFTQKIPILAGPYDRNFFFQGYVSLLFGRRK